MKKITRRFVRVILTVIVRISKFIVRTMDKVRFLVTGRKPVTRKLVEEGEEYDTYQIRFTEVPTDVIVRRMMGE